MAITGSLLITAKLTRGWPEQHLWNQTQLCFPCLTAAEKLNTSDLEWKPALCICLNHAGWGMMASSGLDWSLAQGPAWPQTCPLSVHSSIPGGAHLRLARAELWAHRGEGPQDFHAVLCCERVWRVHAGEVREACRGVCGRPAQHVAELRGIGVNGMPGDEELGRAERGSSEG